MIEVEVHLANRGEAGFKMLWPVGHSLPRTGEVIEIEGPGLGVQVEVLRVTHEAQETKPLKLSVLITGSLIYGNSEAEVAANLERSPFVTEVSMAGWREA